MPEPLVVCYRGVLRMFVMIFGEVGCGFWMELGVHYFPFLKLFIPKYLMLFWGDGLDLDYEEGM